MKSPAKIISHLLLMIKIRTHEHSWGKKGKYLLFKNKSDTLLIIFSSLAPNHKKPAYNYVRALSSSLCDRLYILDGYGHRGSYYWFENGMNLPEVETLSLINKVVNGGGYKRVVTLGTSKGGTAAIYYGLKVNAYAVYAGANQYYVGRYLNRDVHKKIYAAMMGESAGKSEQDVLDNKLKNLIVEKKGTSTIVHLLFSRLEHTYANHIESMIEELEINHIKHIDIEKDFENHNDVGKYFIPYIQSIFSK